jgi:predicted nuclease of predicted toxin-antitoxin system
MWLLDANLDIHLVELLGRFGIECSTAESRGWKALKNGDLVAAAVQSGFEVLVTRDRLFAESASRDWRSFPHVAIVVVNLPQLPSIRYLEAFAAQWAVAPIQPQPGKILFWP